MVKPEDFEYAVDQTILVHPELVRKLSADLIKQITKGPTLKSYTRNNGARHRVEGLTSTDILKYFLNEAIKAISAINYFYYNDPSMVNAQTTEDKNEIFNQAFPYYDELFATVKIITNSEINSILHFKSNKNDLLALIVSIVNMRFLPNSPYRKYIDEHYDIPIKFSGKTKEELKQKIDNDSAKVEGAKNIKVNYSSINKCLGDLISGVQLKNKRNEYALNGELYASQDIGKYKKNQEDSVIIITHPENNNFKFLAIADGIGGSDYGEKASRYLTLQLASWFQSLNSDTFYYPTELQKKFNNRIAELSTEIYNLYNIDFNRLVSGTTFVGAIVTDEQTIISSVGDSRAYISKGDELDLITRDESLVWPAGCSPKELGTEYIDRLRFHKENNKITSCIGEPIEGEDIQTHLVENNSYDQLLLFSDGVTDVLSTDRIKFISQNAPPELITKYLVDEALKYDAIRITDADQNYVDIIPGGKDNTTAAAYFRR